MWGPKLFYVLFGCWWLRFRARQLCRLAATKHMAAVAHAIWTGSTSAYQFLPDLPRLDDSTTIAWEFVEYGSPDFGVRRIKVDQQACQIHDDFDPHNSIFKGHG